MAFQNEILITTTLKSKIIGNVFQIAFLENFNFFCLKLIFFIF